MVNKETKEIETDQKLKKWIWVLAGAVLALIISLAIYFLITNGDSSAIQGGLVEPGNIGNVIPSGEKIPFPPSLPA